MKTVYAAYPQVLLVDATYKLSDLQMPVWWNSIICMNRGMAMA